MAIDLSPLLDKAFFVEEVQNASESIQRALTTFEQKYNQGARPFEVVGVDGGGEERFDALRSDHGSLTRTPGQGSETEVVGLCGWAGVRDSEEAVVTSSVGSMMILETLCPPNQVRSSSTN